MRIDDFKSEITKIQGAANALRMMSDSIAGGYSEHDAATCNLLAESLFESTKALGQYVEENQRPLRTAI